MVFPRRTDLKLIIKVRLDDLLFLVRGSSRLWIGRAALKQTPVCQRYNTRCRIQFVFILIFKTINDTLTLVSTHYRATAWTAVLPDDLNQNSLVYSDKN